MMSRVLLLDEAGKLAARLEVERIDGDRFSGRLLWSDWPSSWETVLKRYREAIDGQMLSIVDTLQETISDLGIVAVVNGEGRWHVTDLQIMNDGGVFMELEKRSRFGVE